MLNEMTKSCLPCGVHQPQRNTYFDGKLLLERDFIAEQDYHRGHRQLHNSLLHGTGTVCGLKIIQHPSPDCRRDFVVVEPGAALDCCGQEIIVPERTLVRVRAMLADDPDLGGALNGKRHLIIGIRRCDSGAEPVPAILPGCEGTGGPTEFGRIAEGFEFVLSARAPSELTPVAAPVRPKLTWVHTITLGGQVPRGVHLNEAEDLVQVAADADAGGSHLYLHDDETNDLVSLLEGPAHITDTASSRESRLILVAGAGFGEGEAATSGIGFWRSTTIRREAARAGLLPCRGTAVRIAVSPLSGALFVLELIDDGHAALASYSAEEIDTWLADGAPTGSLPERIQRLEFDHGFGGPDLPALRGAAMMAFSHDGRFLALAAAGEAGTGLFYLIDISAFNAGGMTQDNALARGLDEGTDVVALAWSLDDAFLYLLSQRSEDSGHLVITRYALTGDGNLIERQGRGVQLDGRARDLAVAPTETRAYVLLTDADGISRFTTVDIERVKAVTGAEPEPRELSADAIRIDGDARSLVLAANGGRLYVAAANSEPEGLPDRGLVAVIDIDEDDCSVHFDRQIEGCAGCGGSGECSGCGGNRGHAVILGHLPFYHAADAPRMTDPEETGDDDRAIDNVTYRDIVPSAATLRDVIYCILARGIDAGPPGPRGDPGFDGQDGLSITDVDLELGEPGSAPSAAVVPNDTGLTLQLGLPAAAPGAAGAGIDDARIEYIDGLPAPVVSIIVEDGRRILDIDLPAPAPGTEAPPVNPIIALSWHHCEDYPAESGSFIKDIRDRGIALAFEAPVPWKLFDRRGDRSPTMLVELQRKVSFENQTFLWATIDKLQAFPITDLEVQGTFIRNWTTLPEAELSPGFVLKGNFDGDIAAGETLRFVFYSDFLVDVEGRPVAGAHIEGQLPTGRGGPGGTFRSWFTIREG